jgi:excisionase family DNA binding protein
MEELKDSYTTKELLDLLHISNITLSKLVKAGKLNPILMGNKYLFLKDDVERFLKEKQNNSTPRKPNNVKRAAK